MRPLVTALLLLGAAAPGTGGALYIVDAKVFPGKSADGLWRPTIAQALAARAALGRYLHSAQVEQLSAFQQARAREVAARFDSYVIQAEGVRAPGEREYYGTEGNGPKEIHLNGLCSPLIGGGKRLMATEMAVVFDGGSCVFQAMYDVQSGRIIRFAANGSA